MNKHAAHSGRTIAVALVSFVALGAGGTIAVAKPGQLTLSSGGSGSSHPLPG